MTPPAQPPGDEDCRYLLREGMSAHCIDSTCPSRKDCDHCISPQCFSHPASTPMIITGKQMSRVYNAKSLTEVHSVMDEIRDVEGKKK